MPRYSGLIVDLLHLLVNELRGQVSVHVRGRLYVGISASPHRPLLHGTFNPDLTLIWIQPRLAKGSM